MRWEEQQLRQDMPLALLIQLTLNINRDSEQRRQPFELSEVLEWLGHRLPPPEPPPQPNAEELVQRMELLHGLYSQAQSNGMSDG
jgi:hypothetical protein